MYILGCVGETNSKYYTGSTVRALLDRFREHVAGKCRWTAAFKEVHLLVAWEVPAEHVRAVEVYLKRHARARADIVTGKDSLRVANFHAWLQDHAIPWRRVPATELQAVEVAARTGGIA